MPKGDDAQCLPDEGALSAVREEVEFELGKRMEGFGNARYIRTLFERTVKIRLPREIMEYRLATCMDST